MITRGSYRVYAKIYPLNYDLSLELLNDLSRIKNQESRIKNQELGLSELVPSKDVESKIKALRQR